MSFFKKTFLDNSEDELDPMLPFMSLLLIIIPVLIGNIAFYHFKSIEVNIPGINQDKNKPEQLKEASKMDEKVILQLRVDSDKLIFTLLNETDGQTVSEENIANKEEEFNKIQTMILKLQEKYHKLDTTLVSIDKKIRYEDVVKILNHFTEIANHQKKMTLVIMPQGEDV
ncbi:MAG: hypothetical protein A2381_18150 [Bdellovibrionales bacterium RIFOXYB1_FULL_37_110]|nr:MAG: hypothetical protein A2417_06615 [Bdellovibrionales bacterium RIFOXYC1_FULL_37_79]OFZ58595.1 MAG: hypothetical protein A2381_18150 [Bdellovibrionales bacterium RIFOXYB1_FULL_37_110]OFZ61743.1 MAG: hypothetical protein A2577_19540 [Bdellovibrionales bacterium RIFOXYD1_FULL_36_51]